MRDSRQRRQKDFHRIAVTHRLNFYSVPWSSIGPVLPLRITETEVIIYATDLDVVHNVDILFIVVLKRRFQNYRKDF